MCRYLKKIRYKNVPVNLLCLIFCVSACQAQLTVGANVGISRNNIITDISTRTSTSLSHPAGYSFSLSAIFRIEKWLYIELSPNITQKNYQVNRTDSLSGIFNKYRNDYLQMPFLLGVTYGNQLQVVTACGGYAGYWISGHEKGKIPDIFSASTAFSAGQSIVQYSLTAYDLKHKFNSITDNRFEYGWLASIGLGYKLSSQYTLSAKCYYYQALSDQQKKYMLNQNPQYNQTYVFMIGGLARLK